MQRCSSPWAAETTVPMCQVYAATTGPLPDPKDQGIDSLRQTREDVRERVFRC